MGAERRDIGNREAPKVLQAATQAGNEICWAWFFKLQIVQL